MFVVDMEAIKAPYSFASRVLADGEDRCAEQGREEEASASVFPVHDDHDGNQSRHGAVQEPEPARIAV